MARLHAVEELQEHIATEINHGYLGREQQVLVEGVEEGVYTGRNRANKLVHFVSPGAPTLGEIVGVRIDRTTPWSLQGSIVPVRVPA
jgi:tRNA-2-methylthio-N6-dimethylallyladenosine synthase